jgi:putative ABC transport system permease protein
MLPTRLRHTIKLGLRSLFAHRLRSSLTTLGIVLGVASVIVMLSVGEAARYEALRQLQDLGANTILLKSIKPNDEPTDQKGTDLMAYGLTYVDLERVKNTIPSVKAVTPIREYRKTIWYREKKLETRLVSITPEFLTQSNIKILVGRGIESQDEAEYANVAVIGAAAADILFPGLDPVGRSVAVDSLGNQMLFTIVGVTEDKTLSIGTEANDAAEFSKVLFIPFSTDRVRIGRELITVKNGYQIERLEVSRLTITIDDVKNVTRTAQTLQSMNEQFHPRKDVQIFVPLDLIRKAEETQRMFTLILGAIAGISLIVGGIGIMNIMLASVTERTREIGIRRALGAKQRDISLQFLVETLVLSCGGGLIGIIVGVTLAYTLRSKFIGIPTVIEPWAVLVAFSVSVFVGLLSGLYPARRAARLDPIEALRHT